ncbi:MAG: AAA family ATPase [Nanoarchaeota archaeon]|nr:AAA family ATPase [Nanoarchaeota archaeon]
MKIVYLLIGPKGSGKSYIGRLIERKLSIRFLQVEPYFIEAKGKNDDLDETFFSDAWNAIKIEIDSYLQENNKIIIESIGTYDTFKIFLKSLKEKYTVKLVKIETPLDVCWDRLKKRDQKDHVTMSEENIRHVNELALKENYDYAVIIDNNKMSDEEIVGAFNTVN